METFDLDVRARAYHAALKLTEDGLSCISEMLHNETSSLEIEQVYENITGNMLEPVIARYWIHSREIETRRPGIKFVGY